MIDRSKYRACLVDLDGTLYRATPMKIAMLLEIALFGLAAVKTLSRFRAEHERVRYLEPVGSETSYAIQLRRTAEALGRPQSEVEDLVENWMQRRPRKWIALFARGALLRELFEFRALGGKLALVSDYPATSKVGAFGNRVSFDVVIASGEASGPRRPKPDPEGFLSAAAALGVEPRECLVIGDREDADGVAAERAGMDFRLIR